MKFTVLGCGALGQLWLTSLHQAGHEVQGWLRIPQPYCNVNLIDYKGLIFNNLFIANNPNFLAQSDMLIVTLKAQQVSGAISKLTATLNNNSPIMLLHNGMGTIEELKTINQPLLIAITTHAARRDGNITRHVASGLTQVGPARKRELEGDYSHLIQKLLLALPDVVWNDNMFPQLWCKLAINCVINPLTALWNCLNGELRHYPQEVGVLCTELATVLKHEGLHTMANNIRTYVEQVIESTSENISSMLQDVRANRHTEIDYITGYLLTRAHIHGVSVPENTHLYYILKLKENNL